jgi:uncharacterized DUF497 family protein
VVQSYRKICWTEDSEEHIARHSVEPDEVEDVLYGRPRLSTPGREGTTLVYGTTWSGRYLLVVLVDSQDGRWYVATAREMTQSERRLFTRKGR